MNRVLAVVTLGVLSLHCGTPTTAGSGGGGDGGTATDGGAGRCAAAPAFVASDLDGKAGFNPGTPMSPPYNFATLARSTATAGRIDVMLNGAYGMAPVTNMAIPALNFEKCDYCFGILKDCTSTGQMCSQLYLAQSGTVSVSAGTKNVGAGTYAFTLSNVTYQAWDLTSDTATDGGCLVLNSLVFSGSWP